MALSVFTGYFVYWLLLPKVMTMSARSPTNERFVISTGRFHQ
ncbi:unnamed protein product [Rhodiola kirilowii]